MNRKAIVWSLLGATIVIGGITAASKYRAASANSRQLIGRWSLLSGGAGGKATIELRDNGTLSSSVQSFGKTSRFEGTYSVGSRQITMTVLARKEPEWSWERQGGEDNAERWSEMGEGADWTWPQAGEEVIDEDPETEEAVMTIVSLTDIELVLADLKGRRTIYARQ